MEQTKFYIAPEPTNQDSLSDQFINFVEIVKILRKECPWDKKQTNKSIAYLLIEEAYEMIDSIDRGDDKEFSKELGDILLHVIMHGIMAEERNAFNLIDVLKKIQHKMVTRHPHVFGDTEVSGESDVLKNWETIKMQEGQDSILQGVPVSLPALLRAQRSQHKASGVGFDWEHKDGAWDKLYEELQELKAEVDKGDKARMEEEFGDLLFALVNTARFEGIYAEEALQKANNKFTKRFQFIENKSKLIGKPLKDMTLDEMDSIWDEAKMEGL